MSAKPAEVPEWGTDLSNDTAPSSGQQLTGWTPDQLDVTSYDNWYKARASLWMNYLNDGELEGDVVIDGDLLVTGTVTLEGFLGVAGPVVIGPLVVLGGGEALYISGGNLVMGPDDVIQVQGTEGDVHHGDYHMSFEARGEFSGSGIGVPVESGQFASYQLSLQNGRLRIPLHGLKPGDQIKSFRIAYSSTADVPPTAILYLGLISTPLGKSCTLTTNNGDLTPIFVQEYTVDSPEPIYLFDSLMPDFLFARRASIRINAEANTTEIFALDVTYDRVATPQTA
jgi:hypothetical protein